MSGARPVCVEVRNNATGEVRVDKTHAWEDDEIGSSEYIWSEGNFSCDCNRSLFFARSAGGKPDPSEATCGDDAFSVRIKDATGTVLYEDGDWPA